MSSCCSSSAPRSSSRRVRSSGSSGKTWRLPTTPSPASSRSCGARWTMMRGVRGTSKPWPRAATASLLRWVSGHRRWTAPHPRRHLPLTTQPFARCGVVPGLGSQQQGSVSSPHSSCFGQRHGPERPVSWGRPMARCAEPILRGTPPCGPRSSRPVPASTPASRSRGMPAPSPSRRIEPVCSRSTSRTWRQAPHRPG